MLVVNKVLERERERERYEVILVDCHLDSY